MIFSFKRLEIIQGSGFVSGKCYRKNDGVLVGMIKFIRVLELLAFKLRLCTDLIVFHCMQCFKTIFSYFHNRHICFQSLL